MGITPKTEQLLKHYIYGLEKIGYYIDFGNVEYYVLVLVN
jgi:hypothetical protein